MKSSSIQLFDDLYSVSLNSFQSGNRLRFYHVLVSLATTKPRLKGDCWDVRLEVVRQLKSKISCSTTQKVGMFD